MKEKSVDAFTNLHPLSNFIFLGLELGIIMFSANPILQGISGMAAFFYFLFLEGRKGLKKVLFLIPLALFVMIINPLFSHEGATILAYFWDDNPFTLESVFYGMGMSLMAIAVILWFFIVNKVMTADKWIHLFGKAVPSLGLLISMVLRFIPKLNRQQKEIKQVNPEKNKREYFSMLLTWGLETSVDTADSMAARGYGTGLRSTFSIYHFRKTDVEFITITLFLGIFLIWNIVAENIIFYYYPVIYIEGKQPFVAFGYFGFAFMSFLPLLLGVKEKVKWDYLKSKI